MEGHIKRLATAVQRASMLAAPGVDILTTMPQRSYDFLSGSSLVAAHVTGSAARHFEVYGGIIDACNALHILVPIQTC